MCCSPVPERVSIQALSHHDSVIFFQGPVEGPRLGASAVSVSEVTSVPASEGCGGDGVGPVRGGKVPTTVVSYCPCSVPQFCLRPGILIYEMRKRIKKVRVSQKSLR